MPIDFLELAACAAQYIIHIYNVVNPLGTMRDDGLYAYAHRVLFRT